MSTPIIVYIGGRPGAGKGTAVAKTTKKSGYRVLTIETGQMIRDFLKLTPKSEADKELIQEIKSTPAGKLVADDIIFELVTRLFEKEKKNLPNYDVVIFDGVPRTEMQARWLDRFLSRFNLKVNIVFELILDRAEAIRRVKLRAEKAGASARADDLDQDVIDLRQNDYESEVGETYMRYNGKCYIPIDARPSEDEVAMSIDNIIILTSYNLEKN